MPEGDTIWRTARTLRGVLAGQEVIGLYSPLSELATAAQKFQVVGRRVDNVESKGKHLLIQFSGGVVLHTHLRMLGSWHVYRCGANWRKHSGAARVVLETARATAVCFRAPVVELWSSRTAAANPVRTRLGPDLLDPDFDVEEAVRRLRARPDMEIGVALMDQTALAGIGNVYKSEILFLCGVNPFQRLGDLETDVIRTLITTARKEMQRNLGPGMRRTRPGLASSRLWVYRRTGRSCFRCATRVEQRSQGDQARSTYWCPRCQPRKGKVGTGPPFTCFSGFDKELDN